MLVFRNQTAFSRFWDGRMHVSTVTTAIRCIARQILVLVPAPAVPADLQTSEVYLHAPPGMQTPMSYYEALPTSGEDVLDRADERRTVETVHILIAMLYTIKNHLRAEWGVALSPGTRLTEDGQEDIVDEYKDLLPQALKGYEHRGLGLTLQLSTFVEDFINLGVKRSWFHNAAASALLSSLNGLTAAYGSMEVIRLVPIPVAHLIHHRQTLALFCSILPFAMAADMDWWAVPLTAFVAFTLYGIEGIAQTYEDPFGVAKIDINLDDIVEDARREVEVMLSAWQIQGARGGIFRPHVPGDGVVSDASSEYFGPVPTQHHHDHHQQQQPQNAESILRVVVSDLSREIERDASAEQERIKERERASARVSSVGASANASTTSMRPSLARGSSYGSITAGGSYTATASQARQEARGTGAGSETPRGKKLSWNDSGIA
jgi:putative membrane protein